MEIFIFYEIKFYDENVYDRFYVNNCVIITFGRLECFLKMKLITKIIIIKKYRFAILFQPDFPDILRS